MTNSFWGVNCSHVYKLETGGGCHVTLVSGVFALAGYIKHLRTNFLVGVTVAVYRFLVSPWLFGASTWV